KGGPDRGHREGISHPSQQRYAIEWVFVRFSARCGAADGIGKSQNPVVRDKRIFDDHVKASGSAKAHRTPAFPIDLVVSLWDQGKSWHWPALGPYRQHRPAEIPYRTGRPAGKWKSSREQITAFDQRCLADWCVGA